MLWAVSSVALYVPWVGGVGPWIHVFLWLWLGVLDPVQGVSLGSPDPLTSPRLRDSRLLPNVGLCCRHHHCQANRPSKTGVRVSVPDPYRCWLLLVLPKRAARYVVFRHVDYGERYS